MEVVTLYTLGQMLCQPLKALVEAGLKPAFNKVWRYTPVIPAEAMFKAALVY